MIAKLLIVAGITIFAIALTLGAYQSAHGAECTSYDDTVAAIEAAGHHPFIIEPSRLPKVVEDAERITGDTYGTASRGFLIVGEEMTLLGLEVGGCLLAPIYIKNPKPDAGA